MKLSIIIPCYNQEAYMEKCFLSLARQNFKDWECIVVNDGSTDRTEETAMRWEREDARFRLVNKENGGLSSARNYGMRLAAAEYLLFIDSDDALTNESSLHKLLKQTTQNPDVVCGNIFLEDSEGNLKASRLNKTADSIKIYNGSEVIKAYLQEEISAVAWNKIIRRSFIKKWNLQFKEGLLHEDELWSLQIFLKAEKVVTIPDFTYNYFKGNSGAITANKDIRNYNSFVYILGEIAAAAQNDEKLKTQNKADVVRLFEKQYYFLKNPAFIANKKLWIKKYAEIQEIYRGSILNSYQKRFRYNAELSHFAAKKIYCEGKKSKFLAKLISF